MIDVTTQINAVGRTVGTRAWQAGEVRVVTVSQSYPTDAADLWDACTNLERIPRWFLPITGDLLLGGSYQLQGNAGGAILDCDPPRSFTATWECNGQVGWIELRIVDEGPESARLELDRIAPSDDDFWEQFGPSAVGMGWDGALVGLAIHTSTGQPIDPSFGPLWTVSDEGRRFARETGAAWCAAHMASGENPEQARAAVARCIAAYLGEGGN
ncbi:polyketide cyclase [Mycobacterium sp. CBMA293]|uniref:polyketide cyclase n=1 Tax=unclassified Mycolicibacterium TaxID=2636767 RepID=UPI0012DEB43B|nr:MULTISPECIES: polyketide cyclase [unclassified Mycolicibacterium]MUL49166.1 polyketide cyclase [Mycolicibacterium sp. CBMA 360]MUL62155.1 polyketide cyclase [Mycolicibacterium sp. CBMA 335]MUL71616.1 polyketide cyclase [Mycolicibacterium sp. CBMA 311]MUL93571.1 polyketide cyclase [Mycolicibacterium sp. CBMA 230]MUM09398.1 polyketide cyclase [Mycolicibacterium sp. CBMA 213]